MFHTSLRGARLALLGAMLAVPAGLFAQNAQIQQENDSAENFSLNQSAQQDTAFRDTSLRVVGVVTDAETKLPVRAHVSVDGDEMTAYSNDKGRYYLRGVQPGLRVLQIRALGYDPRSIEVDVPESGIVTIDVQIGRWGYIGVLPAPMVKKPAAPVMVASMPLAYGPVLR